MRGETDAQVLTREQSDEDDSALMSIPAAQLKLGRISRGEIYNMLRRGEIIGTHLGRRHMIFRTTVDSFLERKLAEATAAIAV